MMRKELKEKILAFNRARKDENLKATDLDVLVSALAKLPAGQLKHILTQEVLEVIEKYHSIGGDSDGA